MSTRISWIRETWGQDARPLYVVGDPAIRKSRKNSNSILRIPIDESDPRYSDGYLGASWKIYAGLQAIYDRWCPDHVFICDDDTYCIWKRLEQLPPCDWTGKRNGYFSFDTVFGGSGFILSKEAIESILTTVFKPTEDWGDLWISSVLYKNGWRITNNDSFLPYESYFDGDFDKVITCHPVTTQQAFRRIRSATLAIR